MCLLIVLHRVIPDWPVVLAANRDERYERGGEKPRLLSADPMVFGGRDPRAGGTWLAVNQWAVVCAVTNRPRKEPLTASRSRGLLCLDAARQRSLVAVADMVDRAVREETYDGFNLVAVARDSARIFYYDGRLREKPFRQGTLIVSTGDANDMSDPKVRRAREILDIEGVPTLAGWIERLEAICRDHAGDESGPAALCTHGEEAGTVSSSIIALHERDPRLHVFRHCQGRPCEAEYETLPWPDGFFQPNAATARPEEP